MLDLLRSPRFADLAPAEIYPTLLDEGIYHYSISTMYRSLAENSEVSKRRSQLRHPAYTKPELLAVVPNQAIAQLRKERRLQRRTHVQIL